MLKVIPEIFRRISSNALRSILFSGSIDPIWIGNVSFNLYYSPAVIYFMKVYLRLQYTIFFNIQYEGHEELPQNLNNWVLGNAHREEGHAQRIIWINDLRPFHNMSYGGVGKSFLKNAPFGYIIAPPEIYSLTELSIAGLCHCTRLIEEE